MTPIYTLSPKIIDEFFIEDGENGRHSINGKFYAERFGCDSVSMLIDHFARVIAEEVGKAKREPLEALKDMYLQYCDDGHAFMSAGEEAAEILSKHGVLQTDSSGTPLPTNTRI